jgi:hypothetical protein
MTWVVVDRPVHYRRPRKKQAFAAYPSARPQLVVHDFAAFIVAQRAGRVTASPGRSGETGPGGLAALIRKRNRS